MTSQEFGEAIAYIKAVYLNWNFDINNPMALSVWYNAFKHLPNDTFKMVVSDYCSTNHYPPNSPFDLLAMIPKEYSADEAWTLIYDCIRRSSNNAIFLNMVLKQYPKLYQFVSHFDIENVEMDSFGNKTVGYSLGKKFKRDYQAYLNSLKYKIVGGYLIDTPSTKLIGV